MDTTCATPDSPMKVEWIFSPAVSLDTLRGEVKLRAQQLYESVDEAASVKINARVTSEFEKQVGSLLAVDTTSEVRNSLLEGWLQREYIDIVKQVVSEEADKHDAMWCFIPEVRGEWCFDPALAIDTLPGEQQERAQKLYAAVTRDDEVKIRNVVEESWKSYWTTSGLNKVETSPELVADIKQDWLARRYLDIVSEIVSASALQSTTATVTARADGSRKRSREAAAEISNHAATPTMASPGTENAMQIRRTRVTLPTKDKTIRRRSSETFSGIRVKKRSELRVWCAADMHAPESWGEDRWNTFTGSVVAADAAPREAGNKKVFNVVLEDTTGLVSMAAWHHHAEELAATITQLEYAMLQTGQEFVIRVDLFSITQMRGSSRDVCPICTMQTFGGQVGKRIQGAARSAGDCDVVDSTLGTQFSVVKASDAHTPTPSRSARSRVGIGGITEGITNFAVLKQMHPPFRVNLAGVITEVTDLQPTTRGSGAMVRNIVLADEHGNQVTIKQVVNTGDDEEVQSQRRGVAYFVNGTKARHGDEAGSLWAYDDSVIKVVSNEPVVLGGCFATDISILPQ